MFTAIYREEVREKIIRKSEDDKRIVSAAVIGSYAQGIEDRWSDIVYRLISFINFQTKRIFIRRILTHNEYDKNKWKE